MNILKVIKPSGHLAKYVSEYWIMSFKESGRQRMIPRESIAISFLRAGHLCIADEYIVQSKAYLVGQSSQSSDFAYSDHLELIMVVLKPLAGHVIWRFPIDLLQELYLPVDSLHDEGFNELEKRVLDSLNYSEAIFYIESFLAKRLMNVDLYHYSRFDNVLKAVDNGIFNVSELSDRACFSYKQFKRLFTEYIGLNPKDFVRIKRLKKTLSILQTSPHSNLDQIAEACNYYDKSHLIKEIKLYTGYRPNCISEDIDFEESISQFKSYFIDIK